MTPSRPCPLNPTCSSHSEDDHHPERRRLLKQGVFAAITATLATACSHAPASTAATPANTNTNALGIWSIRIRPADFTPLQQDGGIARIDGDSAMPVAVVRTGDTYAAFSMVCPHAGATIDPVAGGFLCPGHGAKFSGDGTWIGGHHAKNLRALTTTFDSASGILTITA